MKKFFTLSIVSFMFFSFTSLVGIDEVVTALKNNNASQVATYFDNTVDITLPEKSNSYSKSQAEVILRDFLSNNPIKSIEIIHKGENNGSQYCIGKLVTKSKVYRTTIYMKHKGDKQFLQEIRFENM